MSLHRLLLLAILLPSCAAASASEIQSSIFGKVGREAGIDPYLLYAVALTESAHGAAGGVAPHPYALRVASHPGGIYPRSRDDAASQLHALMQSHGSIDVGMMQVNIRWHGHRVDDPTDLLDPLTNLRVGAAILREAMESTDDWHVGIGRYYTWSDPKASRRYGERVMHFHKKLTQ